MYCPRFLPQVQLNRRHYWRFCTTFPQPLEGVVSCRKWKRTAAAVSSGGLTVNMVLVGSLLSWCQRSEHGRRLTTWTGLGCRCLSVVSRSVFSWSVLRLTVSRTFFKTVVPILLSLLTSETCDWFKEQLWKVRDVWMWVKLFRSHRHFLWWCYSRMSTEGERFEDKNSFTFTSASGTFSTLNNRSTDWRVPPCLPGEGRRESPGWTCASLE